MCKTTIQAGIDDFYVFNDALIIHLARQTALFKHFLYFNLHNQHNIIF